MEIQKNIDTLKLRIQSIQESTGKPGEPLKIVLVTKTVSLERIREAYDAGVRDFGENRIQEWLPKARELPGDIRWHFIGRLQTNKVKYLMEYARSSRVAPLLQSLDREELAKELIRSSNAKGLRQLDCLLQVNTSEEASKAGFLEPELFDFLSKMETNHPLRFGGLMTIGPLTDDPLAIRRAFGKLKQIQQRLRSKHGRYSWDILSMGMSSDYEIAIEEGANLIRIGTAVFGERARP